MDEPERPWASIRRWLKRIGPGGAFLGTVAALQLTTDEFRSGVWQAVGDHWRGPVSVVLAIELLGVVALAGHLAFGLSPSTLPKRWLLLAHGALVATAGGRAAGMTLIPGVVVFGLLFGSSVFLLWFGAWMNKRREHQPEWDEALADGLARYGDSAIRATEKVQHFLNLGATDKEEPAETPARPRRSRAIAGAFVAFMLWMAAVVGGAGMALLAASLVPDPGTTEGLETTPDPSAPIDPDDVTTNGTPSSPPTTSSPPPRPVPIVRCTGIVGEGTGIPADVTAAVAEALAPLRDRFALCGIGDLRWREERNAYEQVVFTGDGEGGRLVAWADGQVWQVTFISPDDARSYTLIDDGLDWSVLGRPLPFRPCGEQFWVQPFVGGDGHLTGLGIRTSDDRDGDENQPFFIWGSTLEALLDETGGALQLPAGQPAVDTNGAVQYFSDLAIVGPHGPAPTLTADDVIAVCG